MLMPESRTAKRINPVDESFCDQIDIDANGIAEEIELDLTDSCLVNDEEFREALIVGVCLRVDTIDSCLEVLLGTCC